MDIDIALSTSFRRLTRRSATDDPTHKLARRPLRSRSPGQAGAEVEFAAPRDAAIAAMRRQTLHILLLAKSRLCHALAISEALRRK